MKRMDRVKELLRLARALDYEKDPNPKNWKTINGAKVHLDKNGKYDGGAGGKFNGNYHFGGSDWKEKKSQIQNLTNIFNQAVAQKQAQANAQGNGQGNGQGNTPSQNVASKATQGGGGSGIITPEIKAGNFPPEYSSKNEKKNIAVVVSQMASLRDFADEKAYNMYAKFGALAQKSGTVMAPSHRGKEYYVYTVPFFSGQTNEIEIVTPVLGGKSDDIKASGMQTWLHENAHAMDAMAGRLSGAKNFLSANDANLSVAVSNAYGNFLKSQNPWGKESQKVFDEYKAKQKACFDRINSWTRQYNDWGKKNIGKPGFYAQATKVRNYLIERQKKEKEKLYGRDGGRAYGSFFDLYDALSGGYVHDIVKTWGHGGKYYKSAENRNIELFANWSTLKITNQKLANIFRQEHPDVANALDQLIADVGKTV